MKDKLNSIIFSNGFDYKNDNQSIYIKLYKSILRAIIEKKIPEDYQLPPTRILAQDLKLSRTTVIRAYELLCIKKYIRSVRGSGHFVNATEDKGGKYTPELSNASNCYPHVSKRAMQFRKHVHIMNRGKHKGVAFRPGLPPLDIFPVRKWQILTNNYWRNVTFSDLSYRHTLVPYQ